MLLVGQAKIAVDFYDVDGFKISYCSKIKHVLEMPSFNMKIDNSVQYHCQSQQGLSGQISQMTPNQFSLYNVVDDFNIKDTQARSLAKFISAIDENMKEFAQDKQWTEDEVSSMLKDAIADRSLSVNRFRDSLITELELVEEAIAPIKVEIEKCEREANITANRWTKAFFGTIAFQFMLSQYGTYYALSWDIIEPIVACVSLTDAIAAYYFWLWSGKPWDLNEFRNFWFERKLKKLLSKNDINFKKYEELLKVRKEIKNKLFYRQRNR